MRYDIYWPELISGRLIRRYQRFKADILLDNGNVIIAHCPNSGSLKGCLIEGEKVYISKSINPKRKLSYTWEMIELPQSLVVVNTFLANRIVKNAILSGKIKELYGYKDIKSEAPYGKKSRIDFLLKGDDKPCFVEVKSCTLVEDGIAFFPDAPTKRGRKHLSILAEVIKEGLRGVIFYLIQRTDSKIFTPACHIDPHYCSELWMAMDSGVEVLAYDIWIDLKGVSVNNRMKFLRNN